MLNLDFSDIERNLIATALKTLHDNGVDTQDMTIEEVFRAYDAFMQRVPDPAAIKVGNDDQQA